MSSDWEGNIEAETKNCSWTRAYWGHTSSMIPVCGSWVILVNMEISVILGHEKTKIHNIIDYGKIDVFSVRTIIHIKNKMMGHLIWPFGVLLYKTFQKWDVPRWRKAGWMIVLTCQTHFFCNTSTILAQYKFQMKNFVFNLHFFLLSFRIMSLTVSSWDIWENMVAQMISSLNFWSDRQFES